MCSKIHMPVVVLSRLVTRKLGLPHVGRQVKPIFGIVERNQVRQTIENLPRIAPGRYPEEVTVPHHQTCRTRHSTRYQVVFMMQIDDFLTLL